jgi:hypothetical protein
MTSIFYGLVAMFTALSATLAFGIKAPEQSTLDTATGSVATDAQFPSWEPTATEAEFLAYASLPEAPPMDYWVRLAQCETGQNWQNSGRHGGGFGFFTVGEFPSSSMGGWERMGGEEFAGHPMDATPTEQIIIATRTAILGWGPIPLQRDPAMAKRKGIPVDYEWKTNPHGYWTWGCAKRVVGDPCGYLYDGTVIKDFPHEKPAYCRYLKPKNYSKVDGNGRYLHNRAIREASAKARADGATSVAFPSAVEWLYPTPVSNAPIPDTALCPKAWSYAREAGFTDEEIAVLDVVINNSSKCSASAKKKDAEGMIYRGWTLLSSDWVSYFRISATLWSAQELLDPATHMEAVRALYERDILRGGDGWGWASQYLQNTN